MKKLILTILTIGLLQGGVALHAEQSTNFNQWKGVDAENLISKYKEGKVLFVRNDSTFTADINSYGELINVAYTEDLKRILHDGQVSYGSKSGSLYYSCSGKLFTAKQKKNGKWVEDQYIEIPGTTVQRDKYKGSVLAYANWRYMPNDSIVVQNPSLNEDETELYFASNMDGSEGMDIWKCTKDESGVWGNPTKLSSGVNGQSDEDFPFVRPDGSITFASNRKASGVQPDSGKYDVYIVPSERAGRAQLYANVAPRELEERRIAEEKRIADSLKAEIERVNQLAQNQSEQQPSVTDSSVVEPSAVTPEQNTSLASQNSPSTSEESIQTSDAMPTPAEELEKRAKESAMEREKEIGKVLTSNPDTVIKVSKNVLATKEMRIFYFEFDKGIPNGSYKEDLEVVLDFINAYPDSKFLIVGHTDERGSDEYNQVLSEKRADWVYFNLLVKGVKLDRMQTKGEGETHPLVKNAQTEEDHQRNRRVEIHKLN